MNKLRWPFALLNGFFKVNFGFLSKKQQELDRIANAFLSKDQLQKCDGWLSDEKQTKLAYGQHFHVRSLQEVTAGVGIWTSTQNTGAGKLV